MTLSFKLAKNFYITLHFAENDFIGQIAYFHHIHLYPKGNIHFAEHALPDYKKLLTDKGRESFKDICFEELFELMKTIFKTEEQTNWINYLQRRYIVDNE